MANNLPSLSLGSIPWSTPHHHIPVGGGGRRVSHEDSLLSSLDEVRHSTEINIHIYIYYIIYMYIYRTYVI